MAMVRLTFAELVSKQVEKHMMTVHDEVKVVQQTLTEIREQAREEKDKENRLPVSYTHLTLPTNREV